MTIATAVDAAAVAAEATFARVNPDVAPLVQDSLRAAARAAAVTAHVVVASTSASRAPARRVGGARKTRTRMNLATKIQVITWREAGKTWRWKTQHLAGRYSESAVQNVFRQRAVIRARLAAGASEVSVTTRTTPYPEIDARLLASFHAVQARGCKRIPMSLAILRSKALQIATSISVTNFTAANGFLQNWARRHGLVKVALHGPGASANVAEAAEQMNNIRQKLAGVDPDLIYNVDEIGILYRCHPFRSYVPADDRRAARGSKAMKSKDRVTLTLCCNATGTHKVPVSMIGKAM